MANNTLTLSSYLRELATEWLHTDMGYKHSDLVNWSDEAVRDYIDGAYKGGWHDFVIEAGE